MESYECMNFASWVELLHWGCDTLPWLQTDAGGAR